VINLSTDQQKALARIIQWFETKEKPFITLGGYAGTGKTTLISILRNELHQKNDKLKVAFCSYTGKATRVLRGKLVEAKSLYPQDSVGTIHSLIYSPRLNDKEEIIGWELKDKDKLDTDLIIVDEASMVDQRIWSDLTNYRVPIIAVGDHGQLPPISGNFNLVQNPEIRLEEIHRQAKENPIISLSIMAREKGEIPVGNFGPHIMKLTKGSTDSQDIIGDILANYKSDTLILCGYNNTRVKLNKYIRQTLLFEGDRPEAKDRVICLRNNHAKEVFNGMLGTIKSIYKDEGDEFYSASIEMDGEENLYRGLIAASQFNSTEGMNFTNQGKHGSATALSKEMDLFDFGYALTVHKAQGSQARRVVLFEERFQKMDDEMWRRWLYTAVTRAESELYIVG
jgi:exodeoxyribonuclease-5